jgi:WhiB family redox-sensing transcriptional regulator
MAHLHGFASESETAWMAFGRCRDMDPAVFFPSDGVGVERARLICISCPVRTACAEYALRHHIAHGVWGGTSERERARIHRAGRAQASG